MMINGVDSSVLRQNVERGYTASSATVLTMITLCEESNREIKRLRAAIKTTIEENLYLADGDICTLAKLKQVMPDGK